jgi:hypothetical protein
VLAGLAQAEAQTGGCVDTLSPAKRRMLLEETHKVDAAIANAGLMDPLHSSLFCYGGMGMMPSLIAIILYWRDRMHPFIKVSLIAILVILFLLGLLPQIFIYLGFLIEGSQYRVDALLI